MITFHFHWISEDLQTIEEVNLVCDSALLFFMGQVFVCLQTLLLHNLLICLCDIFFAH